MKVFWYWITGLKTSCTRQQLIPERTSGHSEANNKHNHTGQSPTGVSFLCASDTGWWQTDSRTGKVSSASVTVTAHWPTGGTDSTSGIKRAALVQSDLLCLVPFCPTVDTLHSVSSPRFHCEVPTQCHCIMFLSHYFLLHPRKMYSGTRFPLRVCETLLTNTVKRDQLTDRKDQEDLFCGRWWFRDVAFLPPNYVGKYFQLNSVHLFSPPSLLIYIFC